MAGLAGSAALVAAVLVAWGVRLDATRPLEQLPLFVGLQVASLSGMALGLLWSWPRARSGARRVAFAAAAVLGWRLAYFPVMVFSGHVASIGEWSLAAAGLPIFVYPVFLVAVAALHAAAALAATWLVAPPHRAFRAVLTPAFLVAAAVSFLRPSDLRPWPDTVTRLDAPVPALRAARGNPYLEALVGPGYWPNQRVILVAAGLTYDTIPPSPWGTAVKAVLEGSSRPCPGPPPPTACASTTWPTTPPIP